MLLYHSSLFVLELNQFFVQTGPQIGQKTKYAINGASIWILDCSPPKRRSCGQLSLMHGVCPVICWFSHLLMLWIVGYNINPNLLKWKHFATYFETVRWISIKQFQENKFGYSKWKKEAVWCWKLFMTTDTLQQRKAVVRLRSINYSTIHYKSLVHATKTESSHHLRWLTIPL